MRNLKKILAMVLALVMSLSLMATAGASSFADASSINDTYETAIEVLSGLGVFNGYKEDGTFRPQGSITRAETAAIIYRIVTGDVNDEQVGIYADYNLFTDVPSTSWYAGYVNFCANAEYIKGLGNGKFDPQGQVTGYAALAMILRAIGYTANGGFTGSDWAVQTARTAEARKITKNITSGTLGLPATREIVAEVLYQAIMVNMVDHNVLNTLNGNQGYTEINQTLGQKTFGLEYVSGVILANEWANLVGDDVLAADKTLMLVTKDFSDYSAGTNAIVEAGKQITLDSATESNMQDALDAVGLTYDAHISDGNHVLTLTKSPINVVAYNEGKGVYAASSANNNLNNGSWANVQKLADEEDITLGSTVVGAEHETEYFVNYEQWFQEDYKSDIVIRYVLNAEALQLAVNLGYITAATATAYTNYLNDLANVTTPNKYSPQTVTITGKPLNSVPVPGDDIDWIRTIQPGKPITAMDRAIMEDIFYTASKLVDGDKEFELGEVYAGTSQLDDRSDDMSWSAFKKEFFIIDENSLTFDTCEIGNSLRVIDNNGDGWAEYVLRIDYTQDQIVGTYKNAPVCNSVALSAYNEAHLYNPSNVADNGTVVNYTEIDTKLYVWPAKVVTDSITNKNFQKITVTTASGDEFNQSGIDNETGMDENIMLMNQETQYNMYMDVYDINIRSYELAQGGKYALLTEMYPTSDRNSNYVQDTGAIAEVKIGEADVTEYPVNNRISGTTTGNWFFNQYIWTWGSRNYSGADAWWTVGQVIPISWLYNANYLQPAVAHLGIGSVTTSRNLVASPAVFTGRTDNQPDYYYQPTAAWYRYVAAAQVNPSWANGNGSQIGVFDYDPANAVSADTNARFSFTNVATYVDNNGTLTLGSASKLSTDRTSGAQLYRVSNDAANAVPAFIATATAENRAKVSLWGHGTEAQLVEAYNQATGTTGGQAWFDTYVSAPYQNGQGIYPIYATDYVQLDLTKGDRGEVLAATDLVVKAGIRHFHIDDNYSTYYNANSNQYVDATINTEFYIVLPGAANDIIYKVGYADLPSIEVRNIRAAYAVANNTSADSDNQDYWIADVVVIEVDELTYDYDSIGLVYYNPFVQDGYTRYADTLNNEWRNLQPDYEGKAKMGITPKRGFTDINWGDASWSIGNESNYKFWLLRQTELTEPGQLAVTSATAINGDYNSYGIYAGIAERIEGLQTSEYMDVSTKNTGCVQTYAVDINYGEAAEVPFYTISGSPASYGRIYTANQVNLTNTLKYSDVKNGDKLIWVYDKAQGRVAFVIDLDSRANGYSQPGWLLNLYNDIIADQDSSALTLNDLLTLAETLDGKADASASELNSMINRLNAVANEAMTNTQRTRYTTVLASLQTKALAANKDAALAAAQAEADKILKNADATTAQKNTVAGKLSTLGTAISAATTATIDTFYKDGKLASGDTANAAVTDLTGAVDFALEQIAAVAVVDAAVKGLDKAVGGLQSAYDTVIAGIAAATTTAQIENYVKDGKVVDTDLLDAIAASKVGTPLVDAKEEAAGKVNDMVDEKYNGITAVENAKQDLLDAIDAVTDPDVLEAINAGEWQSIILSAPAVYSAYQALQTALTENATTADNNAALDAAVVANNGVTSSFTNFNAGGIGYSLAYEAMNIDVVGGNPTSTISFNRSDLIASFAAPSEIQKQALITMDQENKHQNLAVGVSFKAPAGTKSVTVTREGNAFFSGNVDSGIPLVTVGEDVYLIIWVTIASGSLNTTTGAFTPTTVYDNATFNFEFQFADESGNPIGGLMERTVERVVG